MLFNETYDVIVVGAGHAGCEAAAAAANLGSKTILITMNMQTIGQMSCNPAMGGIAKGQIVREIDAMGGYSGIIADKSAIQFKMLNLSKGPAMWSPRTQNDRMKFAEEWRLALENTENLDFFQDMVKSLIIKNGKIEGVITSLGIEIKGKSVVLTNGTFLNGLIHVGDKQLGGGRMGEPKAYGITEQLVDIGFEAGRMKTGTPVRVDGRSLDYSKMEEQAGDANPQKFSYLDSPKLTKQRSCYITYTNETVHEILRTGFDKSPMFNGTIQSIGPRYCPSIEDKVARFANKDSHQVFLEPEGLGTHEMYANGITTSLPFDIQLALVRSMPGLEHVHIVRPGYGIEYDFFDPRALKASFETRQISGLFFGGQINGTTGYEEAAAQGLFAGLHAALHARGQGSAQAEQIAPQWAATSWLPARNEAYIGVLVDDLITKGVTEPYRMFTSRAEFRLQLREDNADMRLTETGRKLGLVDDAQWDAFCRKRDAVSRETERLKSVWVNPKNLPAQESTRVLGKIIEHEYNLFDLLRRPEISYKDLLSLNEGQFVDTAVSRETLGDLYAPVVEQVEIAAKYAGYIERQREEIERAAHYENMRLPVDMDYQQISALSIEVRQKLQEHQPETLGQASRISGVTPAAISLLLIHLKKQQADKSAGK